MAKIPDHIVETAARDRCCPKGCAAHSEGAGIEYCISHDGHNETRVVLEAAHYGELVEALESAIVELNEVSIEMHGEGYNNISFNALLAKVNGDVK